MQGFVKRVVLGLGDGAGGGGGGGVGGGGGGIAAGGNCSSGMDGSKKIIRRYPGRGSVYYSGGFRYICIEIYTIILFFVFRGFGQVFFFRLGFSIRFAELELSVKYQVASFERRLRVAAQTPLALPYPFRTST